MGKHQRFGPHVTCEATRWHCPSGYGDGAPAPGNLPALLLASRAYSSRQSPSLAPFQPVKPPSSRLSLWTCSVTVSWKRPLRSYQARTGSWTALGSQKHGQAMERCSSKALSHAKPHRAMGWHSWKALCCPHVKLRLAESCSWKARGFQIEKAARAMLASSLKLRKLAKPLAALELPRSWTLLGCLVLPQAVL